MDFIEMIYKKAEGSGQRIALPECANENMMLAAARVAELNIGIPVIVGDEQEMRRLCEQRNIDQKLFEFADTEDTVYADELVDRYSEIPDIMLGRKSVKMRIGDPLYMALVMEAVGDADCVFAGIEATTAEVILAAQTIVGLADGIDVASSVGILQVDGFDGEEEDLIGFGDSAICVDPDSSELASIAISGCETIRKLTGWEPKCALLSYSTCGSGAGPMVDLVKDAVAIAQQRRPDLKIDGEFQLDAAINRTVGEKKVKRDSAVAGHANIMIWPNLSVGNIGVKLVQQFAGGKMYGPVLQGFKKTVCDCSRGATAKEVVDNIAMSVVLSRQV